MQKFVQLEGVIGAFLQPHKAIALIYLGIENLSCFR